MLPTFYFTVGPLLIILTQSEYAIHAEKILSFEWRDGEERVSLCHHLRSGTPSHLFWQTKSQLSRNLITNDQSLISTAFFVQLVTGRGLSIQQLLRIVHLGAGTVHVLALLNSRRYVCNWCMSSSLGVNCRHFYYTLSCVNGMTFHPASICKRYVRYAKNNIIH